MPLPLPDNARDFLLMVIASPLALGALTAFLLEQLFNWWESWHPPVAAHDKVILSALSPVVLAVILWLIAAGLGWKDWTWEALTQAVYTGFEAAVGGQLVYGGIKKVFSPKAIPPPDQPTYLADSAMGPGPRVPPAI